HAPATAREHALDADSQREILIRATVRRRHAVRYTVVQLAVAAQVGARHERGLIEAEPRAHVERNTRQLAPRAPAHEIHDDLRRAGWQPHTARTVADARAAHIEQCAHVHRAHDHRNALAARIETAAQRELERLAT